MFTVALIGADGAGKSTICRQLALERPAEIKTIYMGINVEASNVALPTTRLYRWAKIRTGHAENMGGPPDPTRRRRPRNQLKRWVKGLKSGLLLLNRLADEWYRQLVAWLYARRGFIVVFDRHYYADYYAYDIDGNDPDRPITSRIHGAILRRFYPKPTLTILLDAPAEILFARKQEGSTELIERRRQEYLHMGGVLQHFVIVDADQPQDTVVRHVLAHIDNFRQARHQPIEEARDART